ncbi:hypothetical protein DYB28_007231 [Aphanomyces astaci]|uniref:Peptidase C1A papain C-terminal domain-containing protein n=1 Tax=Aphanomyces astaci TaxID=112090 RepID=A0A9X8EDG4_APHAT|nr:hypothetical protein DYB28_007231 [Aphanomyces astaci]
MACSSIKLSIGKLGRVEGEDALQTVLNAQSVAVLVESVNLVWKNYKKGVVIQCPGADSDDAVMVVGYGTSTDDFFEIQNSWVPMGCNGYIFLN